MTKREIGQTGIGEKKGRERVRLSRTERRRPAFSCSLSVIMSDTCYCGNAGVVKQWPSGRCTSFTGSRRCSLSFRGSYSLLFLLPFLSRLGGLERRRMEGRKSKEEGGRKKSKDGSW